MILKRAEHDSFGARVDGWTAQSLKAVARLNDARWAASGKALGNLPALLRCYGSARFRAERARAEGRHAGLQLKIDHPVRRKRVERLVKGPVSRSMGDRDPLHHVFFADVLGVQYLDQSIESTRPLRRGEVTDDLGLRTLDHLQLLADAGFGDDGLALASLMLASTAARRFQRRKVRQLIGQALDGVEPGEDGTGFWEGHLFGAIGKRAPQEEVRERSFPRPGLVEAWAYAGAMRALRAELREAVFPGAGARGQSLLGGLMFMNDRNRPRVDRSVDPAVAAEYPRRPTAPALQRTGLEALASGDVHRSLGALRAVTDLYPHALTPLTYAQMRAFPAGPTSVQRSVARDVVTSTVAALEVPRSS